MVRVRVYVQLFIILITAGLLGTYVYANGAHANSGGSWSAGEPTAHVNERAHTDSTVNNPSCSVEEIPVVNYSNGRIDLEEVCLTKANGMRYGSYSSESSGYQKRFVVSFGLDSKAYVVNGFPAHTGIIPIPGTNDLFVRYNGGGYNAILRYSNLPSLLDRHEVEGQMRGYNFKGSVTGARIVDHPYGARAIGISENGKWALVEVVEKGILKVNLVTGEKRYVTNHNTHYGFHSLGNMRLAISDDGLQGAIIYSSSGLSAFVIEMDGNCGRLVDASDKFGKISNPCREVSLKTASESTGARLFDYMRPPSFSAEGKILHAWLQFSGSGNQSIKRVDFHANGYEPKRLEYLALGDSYSSGEGDTETIGNSDVKWYRYGTDVEERAHLGIPREKCHISMRSYPYLLAKSMDLSLNSQWQTVACSGATAWDVKAQGSGDYWGQNNDNVPRLLNYTNREALKFAALDDFTPGRQKQIEFVKKYQPKVITITMGGNDIGFGEILKTCVHPKGVLSTCSWANELKGSLGSRIQDQFYNLKSLYVELFEAASYGTRIYVIGYPEFISGEESASCKINAGAINYAERVMMEKATVYTNAVIEAAAKSAGAIYVDVSKSLNGGRMCEDDQRYMTGVVGAGTQESYHPNDYGHLMITHAIRNYLNNESLLKHKACRDTEQMSTRCIDEKTKPPIPGWFGSGERRSVRFNIIKTNATVKNTSNPVSISQFTLQPKSRVTLRLHSDPIAVGEMVADEEGRLIGDVSIPDHASAGYHTLILTGKSFSGEDLEISQFILVLGADADDVDENGIKDINQPCGPFVISSGLDDDSDGIDDACDPYISTSLQEKYPTDDTAGDDSGMTTGTSDDHRQDEYISIVSNAQMAQMREKAVYMSGGASNLTTDQPRGGFGIHGLTDESVLGLAHAPIKSVERHDPRYGSEDQLDTRSTLVDYTYGVSAAVVTACVVQIVLRRLQNMEA